MTKRLKYTKDILTHMLNQNAGNFNRNNQVKSASNQQRQDGAQEPVLESGTAVQSSQSSRPPNFDLNSGPGMGASGSGAMGSSSRPAGANF